jgi:hypothetical protein
LPHEYQSNRDGEGDVDKCLKKKQQKPMCLLTRKKVKLMGSDRIDCSSRTKDLPKGRHQN